MKVRLIGGPYDGEVVELPATPFVPPIVHRTNGKMASYAVSEDEETSELVGRFMGKETRTQANPWPRTTGGWADEAGRAKRKAEPR